MSIEQITITPVFPLWLIILLFSLGLAAALIQYGMNRDRLGKRRALILSLLRLGAISLVAAIALNPSLIVTKAQKIVPALAVIVDTSRSMGQSAPHDKVNRLDAAKTLLRAGASPLLSALSRNFEVSLYGLADSLTPLAVDDLGLLKAGGDKGNISETLKTLSGKRSLALLFSDGNLRLTEGQTPQLTTITVPLGNPDTFRDVLIKEIRAPSLAFRDREVSIDVTIKIYGYKDLTLSIFLRDGGKQLMAKNVVVRSNPGEVTASLSFIPDEVGRKNLSIAVPTQVGEHIVTNNQVGFALKVVRDKIRILMVSGTPSMNYRFLRNVLKSDPSLDLLSFVIMRTPSDILNVPTQEQSLIPFPAETIFTKELPTFDLVIFDNFDYTLYLRPPYLESIRKFVREGGGFAMIGGPNLFNEGMNGLSPIGDILPFRFAEKEFYRRDTPIRVRLTKAGARHPITRLSEDFRKEGAELRPLWQDMPLLDGINLVAAKKSATVLLENALGVSWPILTVSEHGKGRVLALTTDYAWKWYIGMVAAGKGTQAYLLLMHRMIRWLTKDPRLDPVQISLPESAPSTGQEIDVNVQFQTDDPARRTETAVSYTVVNPDGVKIESTLKPISRTGQQLLSFLPEQGGIYRIKIDTPQGRLEESIAVAGPLDRLDGAPDHDQLKRIAAATGGQYVPPGGNLLETIEGYAKKREKQFTSENNLPIWATPLVMAIILGLLSLEWYLRRRWGLI